MEKITGKEINSQYRRDITLEDLSEEVKGELLGFDVADNPIVGHTPESLKRIANHEVSEFLGSRKLSGVLNARPILEVREGKEYSTSTGLYMIYYDENLKIIGNVKIDSPNNKKPVKFTVPENAKWAEFQQFI